LAGSALAGQGSGARADMKYTTESRMAGAETTTPSQVITTSVRKNQRRVETRMQIGPVQRHTITLTLCEKKQEITLDPQLKLYAVAPLNQAQNAPKEPASATPTATAGSTQQRTGRIIMTTSVQDLGEEIVADIKTRHYRITNRIQSSGCAGDSDMTSKMEVWVADLREPSDCDLTSFDPAQAYSQGKSDCRITVEQRGDKAAYTRVFGGLIMRYKIYDETGTKLMMTQEVTSLSRAKLEDDALFAVPTGFKQVSTEELQKAQSEAMIKAMSQAGRSNSDTSSAAGNDAGADSGDKAEPAEAPKEETPAEKKEEESKTKPRRPRFRLPRF
jgi:hypothetical protein